MQGLTPYKQLQVLEEKKMIVICTFFFPKVRGVELISADARQLFTPQLRPQNFFQF